MWIGGLGATTFSKHPDLEHAKDLPGPFGAYRFKPGVTSVSFKGYLPYADAAISSYRRFRELRDAGELPTNIRFQVALPTPHAAIGGYFVRDWPMLQAAYHEAIVADIARMLEEIPAGDFAIQWDYCTEVCDTDRTSGICAGPRAGGVYHRADAPSALTTRHLPRRFASAL
jgi:hypothetical protein